MFPNEEPLFRAAFRRCAPSMQILATVRSIPRTSPGKKPASTAPTGNLSQLFVTGMGIALFVDDTGVVVVVGFEVEDGDEDVVELGAAATKPAGAMD
jgi:hypothetical protein